MNINPAAVSHLSPSVGMNHAQSDPWSAQVCRFPREAALAGQESAVNPYRVEPLDVSVLATGAARGSPALPSSLIQGVLQGGPPPVNLAVRQAVGKEQPVLPENGRDHDGDDSSTIAGVDSDGYVLYNNGGKLQRFNRKNDHRRSGSDSDDASSTSSVSVQLSKSQCEEA